MLPAECFMGIHRLKNNDSQLNQSSTLVETDLECWSCKYLISPQTINQMKCSKQGLVLGWIVNRSIPTENIIDGY